MKIERILITGILIAILYKLIREFLIILGIIKVYDIVGIHGIFFSLFIVLSFGIMIKHKYWQIASIFLLINLVAKNVSMRLSKIIGSVILDEKSINIISILIMIVGMFCLVLSFLYFYRLLMIKDFSFKEYFRFKKTN